MVDFVYCESCGQSVDVTNEVPAVRYVTREANEGDPLTFLIMGGRSGTDRLLHRCIIENER